MIYNVVSVPSFRAKVAGLQEELNKEWIKLYQICLDRQWADPSVTPRAFALMMQSMIIGRVIDDISDTHIVLQEWIEVGLRLIDKFCFFRVYNHG